MIEGARKNRTMLKIPSTRNSDASSKVSDATPATGRAIRYTEIGKPDQKSPDHAASFTGMKSDYEVDYTGQDNQPGDEHVDGNRRDQRRCHS